MTKFVSRKCVPELRTPSFSPASSCSRYVSADVNNDVSSLDTVFGFQLTLSVAIAYLLWLTDEKEIAQLNLVLSFLHPAAVLHSVQRVPEDKHKHMVLKLK